MSVSNRFHHGLFGETNRHRLPFFLLALTFLTGILDPRHYAPDSLDLYVNLHTALMLSLSAGCGIWLLRPSVVSTQTLLWLAAFVLILIQPLLHTLAYVENLVFPLASLLLCVLLAWTLSDLDGRRKKILADGLAAVLLAGGCLMVLTQFVQATGWEHYFYPYVFPKAGNRLIGNIAQVNQAAFVAALALCALPYLYQTRPGCRIRKLLYAATAIWLSLGFGFAASRGGLILAVAAVVGTALFYRNTWRQRAAVSGAFLLCIAVGYAVGTYLLNLWVAPELSAVGRFVAGNQNMRLWQLQQAWAAFSGSPLTGVGYGMIKGYGIHHAEEIPWFTVAHHVHNLVGQVAAELGLLGLAVLGGFICLLLRRLRFAMPPEQALAYGVLSVIGLYSLSEFPLWFPRFLMLVPICTALIDGSRYRLSIRWHLPAAVLCLLLAAASWVYIDRYRWYALIYEYVIQEHISNEERAEAYRVLPVLYGYGSYRDMMLYSIADYDMDRLDVHTALGERSLQAHFSQGLLVKQANLYALAGNIEAAGKYYRAACMMDRAKDCGKVFDDLRAHALANPASFQTPLDNFSAWYLQRFGHEAPPQ